MPEAELEGWRDSITIDCCNDEGAFLGGAIAAGAFLQLRALHEQTAKLPLVTLDVPAEPFGRSTEQAIRMLGLDIT